MASEAAASVNTVSARARRRLVAVAACFAIPALVMAGGWVWLVLEHGTFGLWNTVVHESGVYTLRETMLYHTHFVREIPVDVAYALFALAAAPVAAGSSAPARMRARSVAWLALGAAVALVAWALIEAAGDHGWSTVLSDLLQFRTRDDTAEYGSHWRYHLLSTAWFGATIPLAAALMRGQPGIRPVHGSRTMQTFAWGWLLLLTLVFGISGPVFTDVRYAGHQAREIMTHGPVTMLLAIGLILWLVRRRRASLEPGEVERNGVMRLRVAAALLIPAWLAAVALTGDVMEAGQAGSGLAGMVAAHYFEHTLDYILVVLLVIGGLGLRAGKAALPDEKRGGGALAQSESRG